MKTVLLTGATGFLGSHLAHALTKAGYRLIVLKRRTSDLKRIKNLLPVLSTYDIEAVDSGRLFEEYKIDAIIHAATCNGRRGESASEIFEANVRFPVQLLEAASANGVEMFLNSDTILDSTLNAYALSKHQLVEWGKLYAQEQRIRFINIRLEHMYGPGDDDSKFTARVIQQCVNNVPRIALTPGDQQRDFVYVDDVTAAYLVVLERGADLDGTSFQEYAVGSGAPIAVRTFVETVHRLSGSTTYLDFGALPHRRGELMHSAANTDRLTKLGWRCQTGLEQGISNILRACRDSQAAEAALQDPANSIPAARPGLT